MNWHQFVTMGSKLPETTLGAWLGAEALEVRGKPFARRTGNLDGVLFLVADEDERDAIVEHGAYYKPERRYDGFPSVTIRLEHLKADDCRQLLAGAWRLRAPQELVEAYDLAQLAAIGTRKRTR